MKGPAAVAFHDHDDQQLLWDQRGSGGRGRWVNSQITFQNWTTAGFSPTNRTAQTLKCVQPLFLFYGFIFIFIFLCLCLWLCFYVSTCSFPCLYSEALPGCTVPRQAELRGNPITPPSARARAAPRGAGRFGLASRPDATTELFWVDLFMADPKADFKPSMVQHLRSCSA
jgi:hypothetical protein